MYQQIYDPVANSLGWSSLFAVLPLVALFVMLGVLKIPAHWAALTALGVSIIVALAAYSMPLGQALDAGWEGATFGLFPIMWIVINAIWIFNMTRASGHFEVLRRSFGAISDDQRVQAVIIAFSFGALIEALAGFGTPVAISSVMLIAFGFKPIKAASVALVANTAPVAFGAIAIPIVTLGEVSGLDVNDLGSMVGRQTPFLALIVPLILVAMVDGRRGLRQAWPAAVVGGSAFAVMQFVTSNYISVPLTDVIASLSSAAAIVLLLQVWRPGEIVTGEAPPGGPQPAIAGAAVEDAGFESEVRSRGSGTSEASGGSRGSERPRDSRADVARAYAPYLIIIAVLALAQITWLPFADWVDKPTREFHWPGLNVVNAAGDEPSSAIFKFNWLQATGTLLLISGLLTMLVLRLRPSRALRAWFASVHELRWAILTVMTVLALAFVMNFSGETITLGLWLAGAGGFFAFLSPIIGWFGVAVTGSDTSSNSLFGALQVTAAKDAGLDQVLLAAGNSSGGVLGKMISPQNLAIGAAAVGMSGREGEIFRKVLGWSIVLILVMCLLVYLQSKPVLSWMVV
jgi:lactate permease